MARQMTKALCICDGARVPSDNPAAAWPYRIDVTTKGEDAELTFVVEDLMGGILGDQVAPRILDLLSIAAYCFAVDREVVRTAAVDVNRERWRRDLVVCLPVVDPAFWSMPAVTKALAGVLNFGTDDRWTFYFDQLASSSEAIRPTIMWDDRTMYDHPDTVVLFSGGTDSLCALIDAVAVHRLKPVLVSHWAADLVKARQIRLGQAVRRSVGGWTYPHVPIELHRRGEGDGESSQRTRGFLFASLGAAIAAHLGVARVLLPENGYVSINPRVNDQLVGALASRGAHPKFIQLMNQFLDRVFGGSVRVENPLWNKTRAEALGVLRDTGVPELLKQTHSCGKIQGRSQGKTHCGGCSQCIDRRVAVLNAGMEEYDPLNQYEFDLFVHALPEGEATTMGMSYFRFAEEMHTLPPDIILDQRRELDHCVDPDDPDFDAHAWAMADVVRRHAVETLNVIGVQYARNSDRLARHEVDGRSLLVKWQNTAYSSEDEINGARVSSAPFGVPITPDRSRFERYGDTWAILFRDEKGGLTNLVGAQRIARVLKAAGEKVEALELTSGSSDPSRSTQTKTRSQGRKPRQGDAGTMSDAKSIKEYLARKEELERAINVHIAAGRQRAATDLQVELNWIIQELHAVLGKGGALRAFPEEHERARQTVTKAITAAIQKLHDQQMIKLVAHLETFLHCGFVCWYRPDPPEDWEIQL